MVIVSAFLMLCASCVGGAVLWTGSAFIAARKREKYRRWRSQWRLIKGDADGYSEQD